MTGLAQAFQSKNALGANSSTLQVTGFTVDDGNSGNNYTVTTHTAVGTISRAPLSISAVADSKTYDGTTASGGNPTVSGLQGSIDTVTGRAQAFQSKDVLGAGNSTLVVTAYTINDGNGGGNYTVTTHNAGGTISAALGLTISGAVAQDKIYDGTAVATVDFTSASLHTPISGDHVSIDSSTYAAHFADASAGSSKPVTVIGVKLTGSDAGDYTVSQPTGLSAASTSATCRRRSAPTTRSTTAPTPPTCTAAPSKRRPPTTA